MQQQTTFWIDFQERLYLKSLLSCWLEGNQAHCIFKFGFVRQKQKSTIHNLKNWIVELSAVILWVFKKSKGYKFYYHNSTTGILETNKAKFIKDYKEEDFPFVQVPEENEGNSAIVLPVLPINNISYQRNEK